jgi:hypothetical protein
MLQDWPPVRRVWLDAEHREVGNGTLQLCHSLVVLLFPHTLKHLLCVRSTRGRATVEDSLIQIYMALPVRRIWTRQKPLHGARERILAISESSEVWPLYAHSWKGRPLS